MHMQDLKKSVIDDGLKTLVDFVVKPAAGLQQTPATAGSNVADYRSTVFRNASGVLRLVFVQQHFLIYRLYISFTCCVVISLVVTV
jgi:hypothetical protein